MDLRGSVKHHLFCLGKGMTMMVSSNFLTPVPQLLRAMLSFSGRTHSHMWKLLETKEHFKLYRCNEQWQPESKRAELASRLGKRRAGRGLIGRKNVGGTVQHLPQGLKVVFKRLLTQRTQRSAFYSDSRSNWPLRHNSLSQFGRWFKCWFELCLVNLFVGLSLEAHLKTLPCCAVLLELWI